MRTTDGPTRGAGGQVPADAHPVMRFEVRDCTTGVSCSAFYAQVTACSTADEPIELRFRLASDAIELAKACIEAAQLLNLRERDDAPRAGCKTWHTTLGDGVCRNMMCANFGERVHSGKR